MKPSSLSAVVGGLDDLRCLVETFAGVLAEGDVIGLNGHLRSARPNFDTGCKAPIRRPAEQALMNRELIADFQRCGAATKGCGADNKGEKTDWRCAPCSLDKTGTSAVAASTLKQLSRSRTTSTV